MNRLWYKLIEARLANTVQFTQRVSLVLAHALAKVRNFEHVASKMQREHTAAFSHLHECC